MEIFSILGQKWTLLTEAQKQVLKERFKANEYLTKEETHQLSMSLNTTEKRIAHWFWRTRVKKAAEGIPSECE